MYIHVNYISLLWFYTEINCYLLTYLLINHCIVLQPGMSGWGVPTDRVYLPAGVCGSSGQGTDS